MKMEMKYRTICVRKGAHEFDKLDFSPKESDKIITDLTNKIEQYEQSRGMITEYERVVSNEGERIMQVKMKSKDNIIRGSIGYVPKEDMRSYGYCTDTIFVDFNFESHNPTDEQEYRGLAEIIQKM
jgi:hypothetical protein